MRFLVVTDIERAWAWLTHWGHDARRQELDALDLTALLELRGTIQHRVRTLAGAWWAWW